MERFFVFLGYTWRVFWNLLMFVVVLYVFSRLNARLEIILVCVLGLLYGTARAIAFHQGISHAKVAMVLVLEIHRIKELLGENVDGGFDEGETVLRRNIAKGYIDMCFLALIQLVCLFNLFTTL